MSSTTSQTNVIEPTAREQEILQVIHHAGKPLTIQALSKTPDPRGRIKPKELSRLVTDLVERGKLFRFEGLSKSPQYFDQDPYTYALRFLEQMLDTRKTLSNLRASKKLAKLWVIAKNLTHRPFRKARISGDFGHINVPDFFGWAILQEAGLENVEIPLNELIDAGQVRKHPCLPRVTMRRCRESS